jgi:sugar lactone lactonase YvrE
MIIILALAGYLALWPVPIEPVSWQAPTAPGYTGEHAANGKLLALQVIPLNGETGPEHIVLGVDGQLYTGVASGHILRMRPDGGAQQVFSDTGGRPLGMAFDAAGNLIVADAIKGLLSIAPDGKVTVLDGAIPFPNAVAVALSGKIYISSSSARFAPAQWGGTLEAATLDILEQSSTGRVLEYDPAAKTTRVVAKDLSVANGIALSGDEQTLFVGESGKYRVWKIAIAGAPQAQVLLDNLPGYPDNLTRGLNGKLWLGLAGPRNDLDAMADKPFMRSLMLRIPRALWPDPKPYGHVMAFNEDGEVLADLQDPSGKSPITTGATETADRLYIHNVNGKGVGWLPTTTP